MAIGFIIGCCKFCGKEIEGGYELHEIAPDDWAIVCTMCVEVTELGEGK